MQVPARELVPGDVLLLEAGEAYAAAGDDAKAIEAYRSALAIRKGEDGLLALD